MPGRPSDSRALQFVGALVALVAVLGFVLFDWRWGSSDPVPTVLGAAAVAVAVGVTLYRRLDSK